MTAELCDNTSAMKVCFVMCVEFPFFVVVSVRPVSERSAILMTSEYTIYTMLTVPSAHQGGGRGI